MTKPVSIESAVSVSTVQGSYRSLKTWKVMEFLKFVFQAWKVMGFWFGSWKVMENENYCVKTRASLLLEREQNQNLADL